MSVSAIGTTLKFTPAGGSQVTIGYLTGIGSISPDSDEVDVTTLDATGGVRQFIQGAKDPGEVEVEGYYASEDAGQSALISAYASGGVGSALVTFSDGTEVSFSAFIKSYSIGAAEVDGAIGFGAVLRLTGGVTVTA